MNTESNWLLELVDGRSVLVGAVYGVHCSVELRLPRTVFSWMN